MGVFSADVDMGLIANGRDLDVAQCGPDFLIMSDAVALPPCEAEFWVRVDDDVDRRAVWLPLGITPTRTRTPMSSRCQSQHGT